MFQDTIKTGLIHDYPFRGNYDNIIDPSLPGTN